MKAFCERYLPWVLILLGVLRLLWERFPGRLAFLHVLGGEHFGWVFWLLGCTGVVWLLLRSLGMKQAVGSGQQANNILVRRFFEKYGIELLILFLTAASLSMLLRSGYYWDDALNSTVYLAQKKDAVSTFRHVLDFMAEYLHLGRINVLSIYYYFFFYIENVTIYKALIILSILANQLIFRKVLRECGVSLSGARMGMLLIPLMLQTRAYQDPVSGFYSLMQVLTAEMLLCAMFLHRWLEDGKRKNLGLSLLFFGMGLMTYEVCFPFLLMICVLIWVHRGNFVRAVRDSLPFVGLTILMLAAVFIVRKRFVTDTTYSGVAFSLEPERILRAFLTQLCAGLPLSFYSAAYQASVLGNAYPAATIMNYDFASFLRHIRLTDLVILAGFIVLIVNSSKVMIQDEAHDDRHPCCTTGGLLILGLSFAILPTVTVAFSERYQGQLMPGLGYLPVYMQYYGIAMLLLWIMRRLKKSVGLRSFGLSAFSLILLLNLHNNRAVTEILNHSFYEPRNAGEAALHGGILDFLPENAVLISVNERNYLWEAGWNNSGVYTEFYGNNSRHLPAAVGDNRLLRSFVDEALVNGIEPDKDGWLMLEPESVWLIEYSGNLAGGFARLGRLSYALVNAETLELRSAETDHALYFISGDYADKTAVQYTSAHGAFHHISPSEGLRVRQTADGILFQLPEEQEIVFHSLTAE